jgi:hypothetical protein
MLGRLIVHEVLHNLGLVDDQIQSGLNVEVNSANTQNISTQLVADFFPRQTVQEVYLRNSAGDVVRRSGSFP